MTRSVKILYVDDEPFLQMAFVEGMKRDGYDVLGSTGGEDVLDLVRNEKPDIIILDVMMKPLDGWSILLSIKDYPTFHNMSVIMQTGKSLSLREFSAYGEYIDDYLLKPLRISDILCSIQKIVARDEEIAADIARATENGIEETRILEYTRAKKKIAVSKNLLKTLSRLYPIQKDEIESLKDAKNPEITAVINDHAKHIEDYEKLKCEIFG